MTTVTIEEPLCLANFSVFPTSLGRKSDKKKSKKQATKQLATSTDSAPIAVTESCLFGASWSASLATTNDTAVATLDDSIDASTNTLDERAVPLAIQGEGVQFYQADEHQRCLKSWSTGPAVHFCTPPIYVKSAKNVNFVYIGVQQAADITEEKAGRTIWRWIDGEAGAMRSKRTYSVPQPIIALNSVPWASNRLVVLQADGTILLTNEELKVITHSPLKNKNNAFIIQYAVTPIADTFLPVSVLSEMNAAQTLLISIITATPNDTSCLIHWITVDTQTEEVKDIGSTPIKMDHPLVNCALDLKHGGLTVADISGKWTAYTCVFDTAGFHAKSLSSAQLDQIVGLTSETKPLTFTTRPIAVAYVRQDYIACIYRHQVSKDKLEHSLTVWDTRFGTKQAEQALPVEASTDDQCLYKVFILIN
ncbi:hypothetical protein BDF19DRAFT_1934 [Syncephalis fuscata]|nr:hypothetical protein BDF19DRAFT_1934 [Syncephalis fuscata]